MEAVVERAAEGGFVAVDALEEGVDLGGEQSVAFCEVAGALEELAAVGQDNLELGRAADRLGAPLLGGVLGRLALEGLHEPGEA